MKAVDIAALVGVSEGLVSDMLNYKKGLSKETIRILANRFKLNQEAFNRPYKLVTAANPHSKAPAAANAKKKKLKGASAFGVRVKKEKYSHPQ
jgi:HTH-type transcriptional regulator/antitoxin HigA